jgi:hypothetical protein
MPLDEVRQQIRLANESRAVTDHLDKCNRFADNGSTNPCIATHDGIAGYREGGYFAVERDVLGRDSERRVTACVAIAWKRACVRKRGLELL